MIPCQQRSNGIRSPACRRYRLFAALLYCIEELLARYTFMLEKFPDVGINARLDYDDGRTEHYEVEFAVGSAQCEYEYCGINLLTLAEHICGNAHCHKV